MERQEASRAAPGAASLAPAGWHFEAPLTWGPFLGMIWVSVELTLRLLDRTLRAAAHRTGKEVLA